MNAEHSHLKQFSPDQKLFANIDSDGKLKIWDVETNLLKQEYVPNLHLSTPCTAMLWMEVRANLKTGKKKKPRVFEGNSSLYIVLGTNKGGLALYSFATGKLETSFKGEGHSAAVTSIAFDGTYSLFSCGLDGKVVEWNVSKFQQISYIQCGMEKLTALSLLPDTGKIVTASKTVKVWNFKSKQLIQTFTGHSSNVILLKAFKHDNDYIILSGSKTDRNLSLWHFSEEDITKTNKNAVTTMTLQNSPNFVDTNVEEDILKVACITMNESLQYFEVNLNSLRPNKPVKFKHTVEVASDTTKNVEMIPVKIGIQVNDNILIGYGNLLMKFETIPVQQPQKSNVLIRKDPLKLNEKVAATDGKVLNVVTPVTENNVEYLNAVSAQSSKKAMKTVEIPMETRLENLTIGEGAKPNAKNMAHLLVQALHNKDANILRLVLRQKDEETVRLTVKRLPSQYVMSLVSELSTLMSKKTAGSETALLWLRNLIQTHASQSMAFGIENLQANFGSCMGIVDHRSQNLSNLSRLRGRLDLLVNQIKQNNDIEDEINNENLLVYQESDDLESIVDESSESSDEANFEDSDDDNDDDDDEDHEKKVNGNSEENLENGVMETDESDNGEMDMSD